jgi:hypothetical protein
VRAVPFPRGQRPRLQAGLRPGWRSQAAAPRSVPGGMRENVVGLALQRGVSETSCAETQGADSAVSAQACSPRQARMVRNSALSILSSRLASATAARRAGSDAASSGNAW